MEVRPIADSEPAKTTEPDAPPSGRPRALPRVMKRAFDITMSSLVLLLASPLLLVVAALVKLTSHGPVIYHARRAGLGGTQFAMLKFRTMHVDSDSIDRRITEAQDDRITWIGRFLRKCKLDELPQLWNVFRGDMSIVGPRPEDWDLVRLHYTPEHRRALETRPGIACTAEVRWYPDLTYHDPPPPGVMIQEHYIARHMPAQAEEGARYIEQQSLPLDLKVILQTLFCIMIRSWLPPERQPLPSGQVATAGTIPTTQEIQS